MVFRRIYWVTEQIDGAGVSQVTGIYTSLPDLLTKGLRWVDPESNNCNKFRLTLVKLDHSGGPLGSWESPNFDSIVNDLQPYIETQEFSIEDVQQLPHSLAEFCG